MPSDLLFRVFEYLGILAMILVLAWGAYISYDDWMEKRREEEAHHAQD
jgi:Tfp pilus assembly protein PilE